MVNKTGGEGVEKIEEDKGHDGRIGQRFSFDHLIGFNVADDILLFAISI